MRAGLRPLHPPNRRGRWRQWLSEHYARARAALLQKCEEGNMRKQRVHEAVVSCRRTPQAEVSRHVGGIFGGNFGNACA